MKIEQHTVSPSAVWAKIAGGLQGAHAQLVFAFGPRAMLGNSALLSALTAKYPGASLIISSTSGEITSDAVTDEVIAVTAVALESTRIACAATSVRTQFESRAAGDRLANRLRRPGLAHILVISDGQLVNGTELARGFNENLPPGVTLTGGLAGDGVRFESTLVGLNETPISGRIVAIAFFGQKLKVGFGSSGGWTPFGPEYVATSAAGNILFKLDGQAALDLYKQQLGERASELPAAALSFPLWVAAPGRPSVVRTILAVDESTRSMVFAGDIPPDARVRFMHASHGDLIAGAAQAAEQAQIDPAADLAFCISCVGRRIVLGPRSTEELASVRRILGAKPVLAGFYSYGELAPAGALTDCQLHNQTMTITTLREG